MGTNRVTEDKRFTADELTDALAALRHGDAQKYACFPEFRVGTSYGKHAEGRIDLWVLSLWPSSNYTRYSYEVKVTRSDFTKDLESPMKQRPALMHSDYFYYVVPCDFRNKDAKRIATRAEIPTWAGLIEVRRKTEDEVGRLSHRLLPSDSPWRHYELRIAHPAPQRYGEPPTPGFLASLARRVQRAEHDGG